MASLKTASKCKTLGIKQYDSRTKALVDIRKLPGTNKYWSAFKCDGCGMFHIAMKKNFRPEVKNELDKTSNDKRPGTRKDKAGKRRNR